MAMSPPWSAIHTSGILSAPRLSESFIGQCWTPDQGGVYRVAGSGYAQVRGAKFAGTIADGAPHNAGSPAYGGFFTFTDAAPATVYFRIDTVGGVPWILDNKEVSSNTFIPVKKDVGRQISMAVRSQDILNILFYNSNFTPYSGVSFSLQLISAIRPTGDLYLVDLPLVTGSLSELSAMRPTGYLQISNLPLVTDCGANNQLFALSTNINVSGCGLTQSSIDNILAAVVDGGKTNGTLNMTGGTNATPSAAGLALKAILVSRGWTVTHN